MISFSEALQLVLKHSVDLGEEKVLLNDSVGRVLAEKIYADRDFPPFDRATKDGIAINYKAIEKGLIDFPISDIAAAGNPQKELHNSEYCMEIMTGAVIPKNADTVIMYEHLSIAQGKVRVKETVKKGQNIHQKGGDEMKGATLLKDGVLLSAAEIGVLASVGKSEVLVKKLPKICVISTGDELVDVNEVPQPHQLRKSNTYTLKAILQGEKIIANRLHINDDKEITKKELLKALKRYDVLLLSGGVSKGKYDYLPEVFKEIEVKKIFHKIKQRPGKPFWFGNHESSQTTIFAFPGNPVSTFANYHIYFKPWINKSLGLPSVRISVILDETFNNTTDLTRFIQAKVQIASGKLVVSLIQANGSGDLTSLSKANGFVIFAPNTPYKKGEVVQVIATRRFFK
ncbi:molybdopterin molybdotransferase MoeA [Croceitalea marina]|uniref:Molybdopterin molybdenumtransferase n=1 Tax=Croceitalea marina TaxID=1775166 RepID=A0ABW5MTD9_9FLAO